MKQLTVRDFGTLKNGEKLTCTLWKTKMESQRR